MDILFHSAEDKITRGHSWELAKNHCGCNTRLQFFSQWVINRWKSLFEEDISVLSVISFKHRLEKRNRLIVYKSYWLHESEKVMVLDKMEKDIARCSRTR